jgi:hypothetical protein
MDRLFAECAASLAHSFVVSGPCRLFDSSAGSGEGAASFGDGESVPGANRTNMDDCPQGYEGHIHKQARDISGFLGVFERAQE